MNTLRNIPFARPWITDTEKEAVIEVLNGFILTHGPQNKAFESEFAEFLGGNIYCVAVSSCMAALHLAYWQIGIGPGDEVIVPAQTHVATVHAVEMVGARPIFLDCEATTGNIDVTKLEELITPRTKAIGLVHFLGIPCNMDAVMKIAQNFNLKVIEDCALAVGTLYKNKHVGLFGDVGCFSFYPVKHITTGDGGMFVSRHKSLAEKVIQARAFGVDRNFSERTIPGMYDVPTLGLNYRMSDINAAIGRKQLDRIKEILEIRRSNFQILKTALKEIPDISILDANGTESTSSHYCLSVILKGRLAKLRNNIVFKLNQAGIGTSVYYPHPVTRLTYYRNKYPHETQKYLNSTMISDQSIALPVAPHLKAEDVEYIAQNFRNITKEMC